MLTSLRIQVPFVPSVFANPLLSAFLLKEELSLNFLKSCSGFRRNNFLYFENLRFQQLRNFFVLIEVRCYVAFCDFKLSLFVSFPPSSLLLFVFPLAILFLQQLLTVFANLSFMFSLLAIPAFIRRGFLLHN